MLGTYTAPLKKYLSLFTFLKPSGGFLNTPACSRVVIVECRGSINSLKHNKKIALTVTGKKIIYKIIIRGQRKFSFSKDYYKWLSKAFWMDWCPNPFGQKELVAGYTSLICESILQLWRMIFQLPDGRQRRWRGVCQGGGGWAK